MNTPTTLLSGKKIAVIIESQYIADEIQIYQDNFASYGAEVVLMSRLWGNASLDFVGEVEKPNEYAPTLKVETDFTQIKMDDFAAIVMAANYPSVRLRWLADEDTANHPIDGSSGRKPPAVRFFYEAMMNPKIIKAFPCHALWILAPIPEVIAGRSVTCNRVMLGDVRNMGAVYIQSPTGVIIDADMVTNDSASRTAALVDAVCEQILKAADGTLIPAISAATTPSAKPSTDPVVTNPKKRNILMLVSEWGYWGEELVGPVTEFDNTGTYTTTFCTPTGKRPNAISVSMDPFYIDPPLGRSVTSRQMAAAVKAFDDPEMPTGQRLEKPVDLSKWFPERPYWADPQLVRLFEIYHQKLAIAEAAVANYDAMIIVGGSGAIVDLANNQRVHDLILAFYRASKPVAAECYGVTCLAFARSIEDKKPIISGKRVTGHCLEYDYKDGTGFMKERDRSLDFNMGPPPYPLEYILRDATGPEGAFIGNFGHPTSVIVDYPFITGRSTPDSYLMGRKLIEVLDGDPPLRRWGW